MNAFFSGLCAKAGCRQLMEAHQVAHMHKREQGLTHVEEEEGTEGGTAFVLFQAGGIEGKRKSASRVRHSLPLCCCVCVCDSLPRSHVFRSSSSNESSSSSSNGSSSSAHLSYRFWEGGEGVPFCVLVGGGGGRRITLPFGSQDSWRMLRGVSGSGGGRGWFSNGCCFVRTNRTKERAAAVARSVGGGGWALL